MFKFLKSYFNLSNNEQRGIFVLLCLISLVFISPKLYRYLSSAKSVPKDNTALLAPFFETDSTQLKTETTSIQSSESSREIQYVPFNPNTASKDALIQLGFSAKTASTLINFRNKGGRFYKKEDVKKVYGVSDELYKKILPYIVIPKKSDDKPISVNPEQDAYYKNETTIKKETKKKAVYVNINTADSSTLTTIKGIGPTYAKRIVKYRDLLGGFAHKEQLLEVYGIKPEAYEQIKKQVYCDGEIKKINLNTATWKILQKHPYINAEKAGLITKYRKAHKTIENLDEILKPNIFTAEEINRLKPYLSVEK